MSNEAQIQNLINSVQQTNPQLYSALTLMLRDVYKMYYDLFPIPGVTRKSGGTLATIPDVTNFTLVTSQNNVRLSWDLMQGVALYEIRQGTDWDTATLLLTVAGNQVNIDPVANNYVIGTYSFLIKSMNISGSYSVNAASASFSVPALGIPDVTGSSVANNALLSWTVPTSLWSISYYRLLRDDVEVGQIRGNFTIYSEFAAGTHVYTIIAVDALGNESFASTGMTLVLADPIDYILHSDLSATLTGTYSGTALEGTNIYGPLTPILSWEDHFIDNSWNTIQDQIDAGFPYYYQPSLHGTGYYREVFDFGEIVANATVVALFNKAQVNGSTTVYTEIEGSTDGVTWSSPVIAPSAFFLSIRYARIKWKFTNGDNTSLAYIYNVRCLLDIQLFLDSGSIVANASDVGGTLVTFSKTYNQVNSITLAVDASNVRLPVYQSVTTTSFKVLVFDSSGVRKTETVSWKARGVI